VVPKRTFERRSSLAQTRRMLRDEAQRKAQISTSPSQHPPEQQQQNIPSDILVSFTKELAHILYQNYIEPKQQQTRVGFVRFSRNYYAEAQEQAEHLQHIATDLGLDQPMQHMGGLFLKIVNKSALTSLSQIEAFVSTALRIQSNNPKQLATADLSRIPTNSPLASTPWATQVANGTLCMRQFF